MNDSDALYKHKVCPNCNLPVIPSKDERCPLCSKDLSRIEFETKEDRSKRVEEDTQKREREEELRKLYSGWGTEKLKHALSAERENFEDIAIAIMEEELKKRRANLPVKCPRCGLTNPASAITCDCGYRLKALPAEESTVVRRELPEATSLKANMTIVEEEACKICGEGFTFGDDIKQCGRCRSFFHSKCWEKEDGCNQPGCKEETKKCPRCGKEIKKSALKCRYCGQYVDQVLEERLKPKPEPKEASTALTYSIISIFCFGFILGPLAIAKGVKALNMIQMDPEHKGRGKAIAGITIGSISTLLNILGFIARISM